MPDVSSSTFSAAEIVQFDEQGYVIVRSFVTLEAVQRMLAVARNQLEVEAPPLEYEADLQYPGAPASRDAPGGRTVRRLLQAYARDPVFREWATSNALRQRLVALLGARVALSQAHHNCIMTKQPQYSSRTMWHQDIRFWSFGQPNLVSVWLALGAETEDNGCLSVIPGTHGMQFAPDRFDAGCFLDPTQPQNGELIDRRVTVELQPGDALFFHSRTFHAAGNNQTDETKMSVVFTFRSWDNPPLPGTRSAALPEMILPMA